MQNLIRDLQLHCELAESGILLLEMSSVGTELPGTGGGILYSDEFWEIKQVENITTKSRVLAGFSLNNSTGEYYQTHLGHKFLPGNNASDNLVAIIEQISALKLPSDCDDSQSIHKVIYVHGLSVIIQASKKRSPVEGNFSAPAFQHYFFYGENAQEDYATWLAQTGYIDSGAQEEKDLSHYGHCKVIAEAAIMQGISQLFSYWEQEKIFGLVLSYWSEGFSPVVYYSIQVFEGPAVWDHSELNLGASGEILTKFSFNRKQVSKLEPLQLLVKKMFDVDSKIFKASEHHPVLLLPGEVPVVVRRVPHPPPSSLTSMGTVEYVVSVGPKDHEAYICELLPIQDAKIAKDLAKVQQARTALQRAEKELENSQELFSVLENFLTEEEG